MIGATIQRLVEREICDYSASKLASLLSSTGAFVIKYVQSKWAQTYATRGSLKISATPALTWGTATYVTPLLFPLSSALYGRIGLVTDFDPTAWRVFDATTPSGRMAYVRWATSQPSYPDLLLTVHSTEANQMLRNQFRESFKIDCVLFHPDQEAESHTDKSQHIWMAVTDWTSQGTIDGGMSQRFRNARFTVLIDEDFELQDQGLPIRVASRQIERTTEMMQRVAPNRPVAVSAARSDPLLSNAIAQVYQGLGYLHVFIEP